ncbi:MAG: glutaminyl-peptide cyclotransferase [Anaerolineae bacterium]|nr:glutaminyl-peptide cyclotransferase [Anaerolineae bacterium]
MSACGDEKEEEVTTGNTAAPTQEVTLMSISVTPTAAAASNPIRVLRPEILNTYPHDAGTYTQGLLLHEGVLYESAGKYGESRLRKVDLETGETLQETPVDPIFFAEGLALVDDRLIQLTWKEETAFVYDLDSFEQTGTLEYTGEGWGLCYDGEALYMSDGSSTLFVRDPETFDLLEQIPVTVDGLPLEDLNELECVGETIYANVYLQNFIVEIEKSTGQVTAVIDATELLTLEETSALLSGEVLNGIAYDPDKEVFYITGKHWPKLFEVQFVERE